MGQTLHITQNRPTEPQTTLVLPPEQFTKLAGVATGRRVKRSWACDYMDIGGRVTQGAVTETACLRPPIL